MSEALENIVREELDGLGYDLVELRQGGTRARPVVDVRLDRRDGERVSVEDCARASRAIEARLDGSGVVSERYVLEVSSPGVERPLRTAAEWRRFAGRRASVNSTALGGRIEADILGVEGEEGAEVIALRAPDGAERRVPLAEVKDARLVFQWK